MMAGTNQMLENQFERNKMAFSIIIKIIFVCKHPTAFAYSDPNELSKK